MSENGVWQLDRVAEWSDVRQQHPDAEVLGAKLLIGIKDFELGEHENYKARFVGCGNHIVGADGKKVWQVDSLYAAPVDLHNARLVLFHGAMTGCVLQADVQTAYLQAPLGGKKTFLRLPRRFLPPRARDMRDPVVPLLKALYGHPRSGGDWDAHFSACLRKAGWKAVDGEKSVWISPCGSVALAVYVDDLLMGGPPAATRQRMAEVGRMVRLSKVHELARFLGTSYAVMRRGGVTYVTASQPEYARLLLQRFKEDMGCAGPLRKVDTPMAQEDLEAQCGEKPGRLSRSAPTHLGGLLFLVRSSRPDLAYAVGFLTRYAASWSEAADRRLKRIFEYLEGTLDHGVRWTVYHADAGAIVMKVFTDADHGGCQETARSTTGWNNFLEGPAGTKALLDWSSRRQQAVAKSTGEAEVVAGAETMTSTMASVATAEFIFGHAVGYSLASDSESACANFLAGYSRKLRYLRKYQKISLGLISDALHAMGATVSPVRSGENNSDIHTKPLARVLFQRHKADMGVAACR